MARYKSVRSVGIIQEQGEEDHEVIKLLNELASLQNDPVASVCKKLLLRALPVEIAAVRRQVSQNH